MNVFEVIDKSGRRVRLTKERWIHIRKKHPEVENSDLIEDILVNSDKIVESELDETIFHFYKYYKNRKQPYQYLHVVVKYLNGEGDVLTAYFDKHIKW